MRRFLILVLTASVLSCGCRNLNHDNDPLPRSANGQPPSAEQVVAHLNQNARTIQSLEFYSVSIDAKQGITSFGVDGDLVYQKPRNFRMQAKALGSTEADVGSNDKEFWFWFKRSEPALLAHCSYEDFPQCRRLELPIHPDWIAEALCVNDLGAASQYQMRQNGSVLELRSQITTPQGQQLEKVIKVAYSGKNAGRIVGYELKTPQGQDIWTAEIKEYQNAAGYVVPRLVSLKCVMGKDKMQLDFTLGKPRINGVGANMAATFKRPTEYKDIDLARGPNSTQSIRRVSDVSR